MQSRALLLLAAAGLALANAGCDSLTRPNEIQIIAEPMIAAKAPPSAPAPAPPQPAAGAHPGGQAPGQGG